MTLYTKRLFSSSRRKAVKEIYYNSFPRADRMPFFMMCIMSLMPTTKFLAYYDNELLCGFTYYAVLGKTIFVMFFAVDEKQRAKGYGSHILSTLKANNPDKKIIVSIQPALTECADNLDYKRKCFYQKNGFKETGYMLKLGKLQEILVANGEFSKTTFRAFLAIYSLFTLWPKIPKKQTNLQKQ